MVVYRLVLSNKQTYSLDSEDFKKVIKAMQGEGKFVKIKQGLFNTAFIVSITPETPESGRAIGHYDEERGVFVQTGVEEPQIVDKWSNTPKLSEENV